jgi:hypothetical protein
MPKGILKNLHVPVGMRFARCEGTKRAVLEAYRHACHYRLGKLALGSSLKFVVGEQRNTLTEISTDSTTKQSGISGRRSGLERK